MNASVQISVGDRNQQGRKGENGQRNERKLSKEWCGKGLCNREFQKESGQQSSQ